MNNPQVDNDGYLSQGQTIVDYTIRECSYSFAQLRKEDPVKHLRQWKGIYSGMRAGNLALAGFSLAAVMAGVFVGAPVLMGAGLVAVAMNGAIAKGHHETLEGIEAEEKLLGEIYPSLKLMEELENRGVDPLELVNIYQRLAQRFTTGMGITPQEMREIFEVEMSKAPHLKAVHNSVDFSMPALPAAPSPATQLQGEPLSSPAVVPSEFEPIAPPETFDVPAESVPSLQPPGQQDDRFAWAKDLLNFPAVLIWGPQGSGKTSFAAWLLHQRLTAGHSAWVCDPHKEYGQWQGLKVVGAGMDYQDCDRAMIAFANTVKREYKTRSEQANYNPKRETVLVEEFTNWASRCENAGEFFAASLSDLRKIKKGVIFVSHDRSLIALGNAKGFSKARNNGLLELQLEAKIDPATGDPMPALKGKLKYPGKAAIEVDIAPWMRGEMNFTASVQSGSASVQDSAQGSVQSVQERSEVERSNPRSDSVQWLNRCLEANVQGSEPQRSEFEPTDTDAFTVENLTRTEAQNRINDLKEAGLTQEQIIFVLWKVKKGGSKAYQDAYAQFKLLTGKA